MITPPLLLAPGWYTEIVTHGVDPQLPGLYEWRIEGVACYIGQYKSVHRPRRAYGQSVGRIRAGLPYRRNKPTAFRRIHAELAAAVEAGRVIMLTFLENQPEKTARNQRETELIAERRAQAEAGGLRVLNSDRRTTR